MAGSWARRRQPAGRIFCYHRVNDDHDPFFPSMPVEVFERQMRYRRPPLQGREPERTSGAPGERLAGNRHGHYVRRWIPGQLRECLSVLQRYGVPATIFLTTGSVDSGEPLWFDVLAEALKTTAKEFLDLEIDLPRRFWLRTSRRTATGQLRSCLHCCVVGRLRSGSSSWRSSCASWPRRTPPARSNVMLTWDQVRHMKPAKLISAGTRSRTLTSRSRRPGGCLGGFRVQAPDRRRAAEPVAHFAYPNGREEDFASWNKEAIRAAGYQAAVTTMWGLNYPSTDRLELRRGGPWEEDEALFAYKMDWYQLVNG